MRKSRLHIFLECFFIGIAVFAFNYYIWHTTRAITSLQKIGDIIALIIELLVACYCVLSQYDRRLKFKHSSIVIGGLIGVSLAISMIGLAALNPKNIDWMMGEMDRRQHFLGWNFFSKNSWKFPIGFYDNWATPNGMSVMFTDSISIAAIFFKLFSGILPKTFQYFGFWLYLSFAMTGAFIAFIFNKVTDDLRIKAMLSVFFIMTPIMFLRVDGHTSLTSQWLILWALYLFINEDYSKKQLIKWNTLFIMTVLIHPYFLFMDYVIFSVHLFKGLILDKKISFIQLLLNFITTACSVVFVMFILGYFKVDASSEIIGLGEFNMNLNAFVNPIGTSRIIGDVLAFPYQYEGMAYLGVGGILVVGLGILYLIYKGVNRHNINLYIGLTVVSVILIILAVANRVTFGGHVLLQFNVSGIIGKLWGMIRATGRMIWPVWYIITVFAFMKTIKTSKKNAVIIVGLILAIQLYDLSGMYMKTRGKFVYVNKWQNPLEDEFWNKAKTEYIHVSFTHSVSNYAPIAYYASMNGLTMDYGYFARDPKQLIQSLIDNKNALLSGNFKEDTLYVLNEDNETVKLLLDGAYNNLVKEVDGYILFSPKGF